ncbi:hypothetical protein PISL3812_06325 [Talaromyces islandicus]|uniref:Uncharacterized protein n=1 Tax=Talaromyces islandicus TaxID=28573 RepID=A0A0U1M174_TALIS|nr:hypothetical protein PISL3812_06325 [Talaromyces islandicus]
MYAPKVAALLAVMAGVASAAPAVDAFNPVGKTTFKLSNVNITNGAGCAVMVSTEHGDGCQGVAVLDGTKNCDQIKESSRGPVCNGTVSVDFSKTPAFANYVTWEYLAYCNITDDGCVNKY